MEMRFDRMGWNSLAGQAPEGALRLRETHLVGQMGARRIHIEEIASMEKRHLRRSEANPDPHRASSPMGFAGPQRQATPEPALRASGFVTACHSALQFDSGLVTAPSRHQVEGLRATQLLNPETMTERQYLFTPVADWYLDQYAAPAHKIQNFSPHPTACDPSHTCPGCP